MATTTSFLGLTKPAYTEAADIAVLNTNFDLIDKAVGQGARVANLLDNSWFVNPINQRGVTTTAAWGYCLDRWLARISDITLASGQNGLTITSTATSSNFIYQKIAAGTALNGKTVTVAVCDSNGEIATVTCTLPSNNTTSWKGYGNAVTSNGVFANVTDLGNSSSYPLAVCVGISSVESATVRWAALYEGAYTADTLPAYQYKGYATELAECQRYFRKVVNAQGYVSLVSAYMFIPHVMRITPSLTINSVGSIRTQGSAITPSGSCAVKMYADSIRIEMAGEYPAANHAAVLFGADIELSADL